MNKKNALAFLALILLLCPTLSLAHRHGYTSRYYSGPGGHYRSAPPYPGVGRHGYPYHGSYHHHDDDWIVPVAIFGTILGLAALSRPYAYAPPPPMPPRRICRDTYRHYDAYGNYLYSTYVDRPCD
jgi:hypothetical protein